MREIDRLIMTPREKGRCGRDLKDHEQGAEKVMQRLFAVAKDGGFSTACAWICDG